MELTIENLIKIIIGIFVIVAVISGLVLFSTNIGGFFKTIVGNETNKLLLILLK